MKYRRCKRIVMPSCACRWLCGCVMVVNVAVIDEALDNDDDRSSKNCMLNKYILIIGISWEF